MQLNEQLMESVLESASVIAEPTGPVEVTYSALSMFRDCRKAFQNRHIRQLVPVQTDDNLRFGSLIHNCLEQWHGGMSLDAVLDDIDHACERRAVDPDVKQMWHLARAMMRGYATRYPSEQWEVVALEKTFSGPIINPETGAASRSFVLSGKVDGIVKMPDGCYVLEHKTASAIDGDYLDKLWTDFQITIYAHYIEQTMGIPITGILYNVLVKAKLQQGKGETEEEYQERRAELLAKSKTGKTTAKRKQPESNEDFQQRLAEKYSDPELFHREMLYLSRDRFEILQAELWELTKAMLEARRRGMYYQNSSQCYNFAGYHRNCSYLPICKAGDNPVLIENLYRNVAPNAELRPATDPIF